MLRGRAGGGRRGGPVRDLRGGRHGLDPGAPLLRPGQGGIGLPRAPDRPVRHDPGGVLQRERRPRRAQDGQISQIAHGRERRGRIWHASVGGGEIVLRPGPGAQNRAGAHRVPCRRAAALPRRGRRPFLRGGGGEPGDGPPLPEPRTGAPARPPLDGPADARGKFHHPGARRVHEALPGGAGRRGVHRDQHAQAHHGRERERGGRLHHRLFREDRVSRAEPAALQTDGHLLRPAPGLRGGTGLSRRKLEHAAAPVRIHGTGLRDGDGRALRRGARGGPPHVPAHVRGPRDALHQGARDRTDAVPLRTRDVHGRALRPPLAGGHGDTDGGGVRRGRRAAGSHGRAGARARRRREGEVRDGLLHAGPVPLGHPALLHHAVPRRSHVFQLLRHVPARTGNLFGGAALSRPGDAAAEARREGDRAGGGRAGAVH
mmetsp:Transcript_19168/g.38153  ORF Transcript_19168/g.38153 Transcript_19168/m.38153 type:complete len:430 (-) Transcript_19168:190-1479(-)